jgi:adenylate cyclase
LERTGFAGRSTEAFGARLGAGIVMNEQTRFRFDLIQEVLSVDDETRTIRVILNPDPRRYERRERDGVAYLYDKFDDLWFREKEFMASLVRQLEGQPVFFQPPRILSAADYVGSRRSEIAARLEGRATAASTLEDKSEEFLRTLEVDKLGFVILCVDIVGSTVLATTLDPRTYASTIAIVLYELSEVVPKFHGHVLKYTGDGLIAYFPEPSFITKNDLALDCALTLLRLVRDGLNSAFLGYGLTQIQIRIGLDSGEAFIETIGSPETKQHKDIIGDIVSLAAKIQAQAAPGEIYMGDMTERSLHNVWRTVCRPVEPGPNWTYRDRSGHLYNIHRFIQGPS